jgi:hypothetical protein
MHVGEERLSRVGQVIQRKTTRRFSEREANENDCRDLAWVKQIRYQRTMNE